MPSFDFVCSACQAATTKFYTSVKHRPERVDCENCGLLAEYRIAVDPKVTHEIRYKSKEFRGMALHQFECEKCQHQFEDIVDFGAGEVPRDGKPCQMCGEPAMCIISSQIDRDSERYPRWDPALGIRLESKQHRREVCADPRRFGLKVDTLIPVDGDYDEDKMFSPSDIVEDEDEQDWLAYQHEIEHSPAFSEYRRDAAMRDDR